MKGFHGIITSYPLGGHQRRTMGAALPLPISAVGNGNDDEDDDANHLLLFPFKLIRLLKITQLMRGSR